MKRAGILMVLIIFVFPSVIMAKSKELVICDWGGAGRAAQKAAFYDPFEKETGIKVIPVSQPNVAKIKAMAAANNMEWDVVGLAAGMLSTIQKYDLVEKPDYSYFDKKTLAEMYPDAKRDNAVGAFYFSMVLTWSTDAFPGDSYPKNWAEFYDVKRFPGARTLHSPGGGGSTGWESALMATGVPKEKVYDNPDLVSAFKKMREIKPHIKKWWKYGQEPGQLLSDKEVVLAEAYNGRIQQLIEKGVPLAYHWNEGRLYLFYWVIPKGAKNYENACKFAAFASRADRQAHFAKVITYGPINKKAFELLPPDRARILPSYPENFKQQYLLGEKFYSENLEKIVELWNEWILKK